MVYNDDMLMMLVQLKLEIFLGTCSFPVKLEISDPIESVKDS